MRRTSIFVRVLLAVTAAVLILAVFAITVHPQYELSESALRYRYAVVLFFWSIAAGAAMLAGRTFATSCVPAVARERACSVAEFHCVRRI